MERGEEREGKGGGISRRIRTVRAAAADQTGFTGNHS